MISPHPPPPTHNHIFLCAGLGEWMYSSMGGIRPAANGYANITVAPHVSKNYGPSAVNASVRSAFCLAMHAAGAQAARQLLGTRAERQAKAAAEASRCSETKLRVEALRRCGYVWDYIEVHSGRCWPCVLAVYSSSGAGRSMADT